MSHDSNDPAMVRVDFFKERGKWYTTEAVEWTGPYLGKDEATGKVTLIHDSFVESLAAHFEKSEDPTDLAQKGGRWRLEEMVAVCLEPYHEHSHPLMVRVADAKRVWAARLEVERLRAEEGGAR